ALNIPLKAGGRVVGVIEVWESAGRREFSAEELALAEGIAQYAATALENAQLFQQVKQAEEALAHQAQDLSRSNEELEQFAYVASHDLQEPLRMVASYTQLLARRYKDQLDADADEFIEYTVDGVTRMQELINGLLAYSRVGTQGNSLQPSDCSSIFDQVLSNLQEAIQESSAVVTRDALPTVMGDAPQLGQLFQNLVGNAIKFHGENPPQVHVSAERNDKEWVFSVRDNGIGIDRQYADRIFTIFQRLHNREEYPGTGIGLSISKKIVERHGGRIWVESEPGEGSTFCFTIPDAGDNQGDDQT
ncbi:MAG: ATP-binding protein, partial [Dehalococcoidia bacterium]